jgi:hypothetical protein
VAVNPSPSQTSQLMRAPLPPERALATTVIDSGDDALKASRRGAYRVTTRHAHMLELAVAGLSDEEIAARFGVPDETLRGEFELVFRSLRVSNRREAVAVWRTSRGPVHAPRPADECPYPKPFLEHFADCPAYQAREVITTNMAHQPVGRIWTCRHLEARLIAETRNRWYAACILGNAERRRRWVRDVGSVRVRQLNELIHDLATITGPRAQRLWELKSEQMRALDQKQDPTPATRSMEELAARFMSQIEAFLVDKRDLLDANDLPLDALLDLARLMIGRMLEPGWPPATWDIPNDVLVRFPADVWLFFRPGEYRPVLSAAVPASRPLKTT